jgi:hypothetical protein
MDAPTQIPTVLKMDNKFEIKTLVTFQFINARIPPILISQNLAKGK